MNIWTLITGLSTIALVAGLVTLLLSSNGFTRGRETVAGGYMRFTIAGAILVWVGIAGFMTWFLYSIFSSVSDSF